jgi:hypothetical protein
VNNAGATVHFDASEVTAYRSPSACRLQNPPRSPDDLYSLDVVDKHKPPTPWPMMAMLLHPSAVVGEAYDLVIEPWQPLNGPVTTTTDEDAGPPINVINTNEENAQTSDDVVRFSFERGSDQTTVDRNAFTKATITVLAFPAKDGEPLTVRVQLSFSDNQILDQTFSAPLVTESGSCGEG